MDIDKTRKAILMIEAAKIRSRGQEVKALDKVQQSFEDLLRSALEQKKK